MASTKSQSVGAPERRMGRSVHYTISYLVQGANYGTDGAIVLLHDIPAGAFAWEETMKQLTGLNRAVYAFDMLGYGLSDHPWPADTSVWGQADVLSYLFKELNLTNVILVGHGLGGGVAQVLATRLYRQQTAGLVLIDTICYQYTHAPNWPLPEMEKMRDFDAPRHMELPDMLKALSTTLPQASSDPRRFADNIEGYVAPWNSELGKEVLFQHIRNLVPFYLNAVSTDLQVTGIPTLVVWGEKDTLIPLTYAERLQREIPGTQLVVIPKAGHAVPFDAANALAQALMRFIQTR